ncbi:RiPP maturation radical SAM C-methyltransferase [Catenulispora yoronensis]|uniref:RiPP maturation radical SAM C-methyltransferase n=1 Tax=Catenulispora yoronensis TaxID=450799 RepID=UPI0031D95ACC
MRTPELRSPEVRTSEVHTSEVRSCDVCLVSMPYVDLERPSMALGLIQSILAEDGISSQVVHANLMFAETVGPKLYSFALGAPTTYLLGEWTFARAAFGPRPEQDESYLRLLSEAGATNKGRDSQAIVAAVTALRDAATDFVDVIARRVLATGARVVGCTSTFEQHVGSLALLRRIHELDPEVITMLGGANCETVMGEATHRCFPWVDYVVSGEADALICDLVRKAMTRGREVEPAELAPGVLGPRHRDAEPAADPSASGLPRSMFNSLDSLPVPRFDDYFDALATSPLRSRIRPGIPVETSRGCWWGDKHQCTFCGLNGLGMSYRSKSPDRVLAEFRTLADRYGVNGFEVVDNILDMRYFKTLLPQLADDSRDWRLFYEVKANLSRAQVDLLARAGVRWIQPGIESLHSEVLKLMDKGVTATQNIQLLKWSLEAGIRVSWSLIWAFPGEKDDYYRKMAQWIPLLEHLQAPGGLNRLRFDRYSVYHAQAQKLGLVLFPIPSLSYIYPVGNRDLDDLAYFFTTEPSRAKLDTDPEPGADPAAGPGVRAVQEATNRWVSAFGARTRPVLTMTDQDEVLDVVDTRGCARRHRTSLKHLDRAVLLACDAAPRPDNLVELVERDYGISASPDQVAQALDALVRDNLVLLIDDRALGLAVNGTVAPIPNESEFPGGSARLTDRLEA